MHPFFLDAPSGPLFALHHAAARHDRGESVVVVPPFAEEMNRSRRMMALLARALSAAGIGCLLLDLYGTGDSAGDFGDARWDIWRADVDAAAQWLATRGQSKPHLLGIRLGGLLAAACRQERPDAYERLVLWQPVTNGEGFVTQFLRILSAAAMAGSEGTQSTKALRQRLQNGDAIEVAGYLLDPALAAAIDGLRLAELLAPEAGPVTWLELAGEAGKPLPPASRAVVETLRQRGVAVDDRVVAGEPFWARMETTVAPALVTATTQALAP